MIMALSNTLTRRLIYHGLRSLGRWQGRLERRLTQLGRFTLAAGFTAGVFGIDTRINLLYQAFAFAAALLLVSGLSVFYSELRLRRRFRATRSLPRYASVDAPISYLVAIGAQEQELLRGFFIEEQLPDPHPSLETFLYTDLADDSGANRFDQAIGYPRWQGLTRLGRWAEKPTIQPLSAPLEQGEMTERIALRPLRRGYLRLSGLLLSRPDPLGLLRTNLRLSCEQSLLVLPRRYPVPPFSLPGRRQYQPGGVTLASSIGDSQEFMGLREYRSGDSPRNIHWPSWARSGKPQIKEYQDEFFTRHALILDTFTDQSFDPCFESAISVAASLCESMQDGDSLLD
ncbi:MAG: DUF58 domain-containing protein, partial [bacterium]|nr:DUF58 domain-containing protein [bacterium]